MFLFELILDFIFELPVILCEELMCLVIPENKFTEKQKCIVSLIIHIFTGILLTLIFVGIVLQFNEEPLLLLGKYLIFIPLGIIALQSIIGIIIKIVKKR